MTMSRSAACLARSFSRRLAYSIAESRSWIEQGPTTTSRRSSLPVMMRSATRRESSTKTDSFSPSGSWSISRDGERMGRMRSMRRSSVGWVWLTVLRAKKWARSLPHNEQSARNAGGLRHAAALGRQAEARDQVGEPMKARASLTGSRAMREGGLGAKQGEPEGLRLHGS